jgi:2-polyprenyl-6-hydroxyphenyl methylase/3-demethylubiquinone-9 3-methyltransferase
VAKLHGLESGVQVEYLQSTAEAMAREHAGQYDLVTCLEMLEHVPDPGAVVAACAQLVKPGGNVFFSTINRNPKAWLFAIVGAEHILRLLPAGTHEYGKFIRPSELSGWCRDAGLSVRELTGMHYNPLAGTYRLGRDVSVNYLLHATRDA